MGVNHLLWHGVSVCHFLASVSSILEWDCLLKSELISRHLSKGKWQCRLFSTRCGLNHVMWCTSLLPKCEFTLPLSLSCSLLPQPPLPPTLSCTSCTESSCSSLYAKCRSPVQQSHWVHWAPLLLSPSLSPPALHTQCINSVSPPKSYLMYAIVLWVLCRYLPSSVMIHFESCGFISI